MVSLKNFWGILQFAEVTFHEGLKQLFFFFFNACHLNAMKTFVSENSDSLSIVPWTFFLHESWCISTNLGKKKN